MNDLFKKTYLAILLIFLCQCDIIPSTPISSARAPAALPHTQPSPPAPPPAQRASTAKLTHGIASGDVSDTKAVIWARADSPTTLEVMYWPAQDERAAKRVSMMASPEADLTATVTLSELTPGTHYLYKVWVKGAQSALTGALTGEFKTAPEANAAQPVTFAWSGDLGGQNICRGLVDGYPIFKHIPAERLDFFIALGDMIYADNTCRPQGRFKRPQHPGLQQKATRLEDFWAAWRYNRADAGYREFLSKSSVYAVWDDHEVVNNFGPAHDRRDDAPYQPGVALMPMGRKAFMDYNPLRHWDKDPERFYKSVRWGKHLELFFLDTRQYRDLNKAADTAPQPKSMLGVSQKQWLIKRMTQSDATWKVVISSVPLSIPTGNYGKSKGIDSWSKGQGKTGFWRELGEIWAELAKHKVHNQLWLTTDVHFGAIFRYEPFPKAHTGFEIHELIAGPLSAMLFPIRTFDRTLNPERLWMYGPANKNKLKRFDQALKWMNFGQIEIDAKGELRVRYINGLGEQVHQMTLKPKPSKP